MQTTAQSKRLAKLRRENAAYLLRWKAAGKPTASYVCPACKASIETTVPSDEGQRWTTAATCTGCGEFLFTIRTTAGILVSRAGK